MYKMVQPLDCLLKGARGWIIQINNPQLIYEAWGGGAQIKGPPL